MDHIFFNSCLDLGNYRRAGLWLKAFPSASAVDVGWPTTIVFILGVQLKDDFGCEFVNKGKVFKIFIVSRPVFEAEAGCTFRCNTTCPLKGHRNTEAVIYEAEAAIGSNRQLLQRQCVGNIKSG